MAAANASGSEFGEGIAPHPGRAQRLEIDFDGDGQLDELHLVRIAPGARPAPGVQMANLWRRRALPKAGVPLALAIARATGARHLLHDAEFFSTPIWRSKSPPLEVVSRGSPRYRKLARLARGAQGDLLLLGTEAGIDIVLSWNGRHYALAHPDEIP